MVIRQNEAGSPASTDVLAQAVESSMVVAQLRHVCRGSLVGAVLTRLWRSLSGQSSWLGTRLAGHLPTREFPRATPIAAGSRLLRAIDTLLEAGTNGWTYSAAKRVVVDGLIGPLQSWQRVRLAGGGVVVAAAVHAALTMAALAESFHRMAIWSLIVTIGLGLVVGCRPVAAAWDTWRRRRFG